MSRELHQLCNGVARRKDPNPDIHDVDVAGSRAINRQNVDACALCWPWSVEKNLGNDQPSREEFRNRILAARLK